MKKKFLLSLISLILFTSCGNNNSIIEGKFYYFDTLVNVKLYEGDSSNKLDIGNILMNYSNISDNYFHIDGYINPYDINDSHEDMKISPELYDLISTSFAMQEISNGYFNPLIGSLSKKWKESLKNGQILDENIIFEELEKLSSSSITLKEDNYILRNGEAELDLGAITKGYVLDKVKEYLDEKEMKCYLIDAGSSSILLGEKDSNDGYFNVSISGRNSYLSLKDCFIASSGTSIQGVVIDGVTYSHIVNPFTGSVINNYDATYVIGNSGALCDVLSTSFMMMDLDMIKELEEEYDVKALIYKNDNIYYINEGIEVKYH